MEVLQGLERLTLGFADWNLGPVLDFVLLSFSQDRLRRDPEASELGHRAEEGRDRHRP